MSPGWHQSELCRPDVVKHHPCVTSHLGLYSPLPFFSPRRFENVGLVDGISEYILAMVIDGSPL